MKNLKLVGSISLIAAASFCVDFQSMRTRPEDSFMRRMKEAQRMVGMIPDANATITDAANSARFLYYLVAGPPSTGYPSGMEGPENGLVGMIAEVLGPNALQSGLSANGITTCSQIPASGSVTMADTGGSFVMSFGASQLTIPSGWAGAGGAFDKRVSVSYNGTSFMVTELKCDTGSLVSGYLLFDTTNVMDDEGDSQNRLFETYFQFDSNTNMARLDFGMSASGSFNEKFMIRFETTDGDEYQVWAIRGAADGTAEGTYIGARGKSSTQVAEVRHVGDTDGTVDDTTAIASSSDQFCVNLSTNSLASGQCGSLAVSNPSTSPLVGGGSWTINSVYNSMSLSSL